MSPILKAYYGDIFFEFLLQEKVSDAVILLPGFPSRNNYDGLMQIFKDRGFHVFFPRYKGTYESKGTFLKGNIIQEMNSFLKRLKSGTAISLWDMSKKSFRINNLILIGGSFSGAIICSLAGRNKNIKKAILFAPVWDFQEHNQNGDEQDLSYLTKFVKRAFQNCYRYNFDDITKQLKKYREIFKDCYKNKITIPILVFHDPKDKTVSINHTYTIQKDLPKIKLIKHSYGHGLSQEVFSKYSDEIMKFIKYD